MSRILVDKEWFELVSGSSLYETEFEALVKDQASHLFPGYFVVPFKMSIVSDDDVRRPDLVMVDRKYRDWWVVEVELGHHSLYGHVMPQVRTFSNGVYDRSVVEYLCRQEPELSYDAMLDLTKGEQPNILVIVDTPKPEWQDALRAYRARLSAVEVYQSTCSEYIYRVVGDIPRPPVAAVSKCNFDPLLPRLLEVHSPAALKLGNRQEISITYRGAISLWSRVEVKNKVWLRAKSANPLNPALGYQIERLEDGAFMITDTEKRG